MVHEHTSHETGDHEDHTFNGIMFNVSVPTVLPMDFVRIDSVSVRGCVPFGARSCAPRVLRGDTPCNDSSVSRVSLGIVISFMD